MRSGLIRAEPAGIGQAVAEVFGNAGSLSATVGSIRVGTERNEVEYAQAYANPETRRDGPDPMDNFPEETRPVFERAAKGTATGNGAQEFVAQISVAMLDVHELIAQIGGHSRGLYIVVYNGSYLAVRHHRVIRAHAEFTVEDGVTVQDSGFHPAFVRGPTEPSRVRQLQPDHQIVGVANVQPVGGTQRF